MTTVYRIDRTWRILILAIVVIVGICNRAKAQFSIAAPATGYTQDFNTLTTGTWTDNTTLTGWYTKTDATASFASYAANTGSTTTAGLYAFGVAGTNPLTDRALGYVASNALFGTAGTQKGYLGWRLVNNTGSPITSLTVTWTGEEWRKENNASSQTLTLEYQTGATVTNLTAGAWTAAPSTFTSPVFGATAATTLDGNAAANRTAGISVTITFATALANGNEVMLRWVDLNDSGNDHSLAIDDVTINATISGSCTAPTAQASSLTSTSVSCSSVTLNWTRGNGNNVLVTGIGGASPTTGPGNGTSYTANSVFTAGSSVGGGYALYDGSGTSVTVTGLAGNTQYTFAVYEYSSTGTCFLTTSPATVTFTTAACSGTQCPYITSVLVNACDGGGCLEGDNEIIFMNTGSSSVTATPANIQTYYGSSASPTTNYTESFATNAGTISAMNSGAGCGTLFVDASSGINIPANAPVMIVRSSLCQTGYNWTNLCGAGTVYVLFSTDASWATGGNFVNGGGIRYFQSNFSGCVTNYSYDSDQLVGGNGAFITYGTSGGAPSSYTNTGCTLPLIVLPVSVLDFSAKKDGPAVQLNWSTAEEKEVDHFGIERSSDGVSYTLLSTIPSQLSNGNRTYRVSDEAPLKGTGYYRLYSVGTSGRQLYLRTIAFDFNERLQAGFAIAYGDETIEIKLKEQFSEEAVVCLYNLAGRLVGRYAFTGSSAILKKSELEKGMYLVRTQDGIKVYNDKIIIY